MYHDQEGFVFEMQELFPFKNLLAYFSLFMKDGGKENMVISIDASIFFWYH